LRKVDLHVPAARYDETTVLPLPGAAGATVLLVGQSSYESLTPAEAGAVPSVLAVEPAGGRVSPAVAGDRFSVGPLAVADLDGDGRLDIVATSWGRNTNYRVDATHPLLLYYGDFTGSGSWDMIEAQYDERLGVVAPLTQLPRLMTALPAVRLNTRTFAAYANASLHDVLGRGLEGAQHLQAATLDHTVFINRGGTFQGVALPPEAQFAPAFYAGV